MKLPKALEELIDVMMKDDFVDRRKALDEWIKRWVMSAEVVSKIPRNPMLTLRPKAAIKMIDDEREKCFNLLRDGIVTEEGTHTRIYEDEENDALVKEYQIHVIRSRPYGG